MTSSLPRNFLKYCPHCGSGSFRAVSDKEFLCADGCGFRFFTNSAAAVAAVIVDGDGRVMLSRRAVEPWKGMLDLPGGFVDPGESLEEALKRELREELDFEPADATYLCSYPNRYIFSGYMVRTTDAAFVCHADSHAFEAKDDIDAIEWYAVDEMPMERVVAESIKNILRHYADSIKQ